MDGRRPSRIINPVRRRFSSNASRLGLKKFNHVTDLLITLSSDKAMNLIRASRRQKYFREIIMISFKYNVMEMTIEIIIILLHFRCTFAIHPLTQTFARIFAAMLT